MRKPLIAVLVVGLLAAGSFAVYTLGRQGALPGFLAQPSLLGARPTVSAADLPGLAAPKRASCLCSRRR
jgi:hypothetical protein